MPCSSAVITRFIKPSPEQDLARSAVIFSLFAGVTLLFPVALLGTLFRFWSETPAWAPAALLTTWAVTTLASWVQVVLVVRAAPRRHASVGLFHVLQLACLGMAAVMTVGRGDLPENFFSIWVICLDVALLVFFVCLFLLALCTRTRLPWHAVLGFLSVCGSLYLSVAAAIRG